jgi:hypothetical protein
MIDQGDLVVQQLGVGLVEEEAFLDPTLTVSP